ARHVLIRNQSMEVEIQNISVVFYARRNHDVPVAGDVVIAVATVSQDVADCAKTEIVIPALPEQRGGFDHLSAAAIEDIVVAVATLEANSFDIAKLEVHFMQRSGRAWFVGVWPDDRADAVLRFAVKQIDRHKIRADRPLQDQRSLGRERENW